MENNFVSLLVNLFCNAERKIVGIYAFAYLFPILAAVIVRIPLLGSNIASLISPFGLYAIASPLTIVFFGPFFFLLLLEHSSSVTETFVVTTSLVFWGSILLYPVVSYFLLRGSRVAWILPFVSSLATISLDIYSISASLWTAVVPIWFFGIVVNFLILCLLYSCRTEFF